MWICHVIPARIFGLKNYEPRHKFLPMRLIDIVTRSKDNTKRNRVCLLTMHERHCTSTTRTCNQVCDPWHLNQITHGLIDLKLVYRNSIHARSSHIATIIIAANEIVPDIIRLFCQLPDIIFHPFESPNRLLYLPHANNINYVLEFNDASFLQHQFQLQVVFHNKPEVLTQQPQPVAVALIIVIRHQTTADLSSRTCSVASMLSSCQKRSDACIKQEIAD